MIIFLRPGTASYRAQETCVLYTGRECSFELEDQAETSLDMGTYLQIFYSVNISNWYRAAMDLNLTTSTLRGL